MADQPADKVTPDTVVQVSANLEYYITQRAATRAEAALVRARSEAAEQLEAVQTEVRYERATVRELRRQLEDAHRTIRRQKDDIEGAERGERAADQQVERLQRETRDIRTELAGASAELEEIRRRDEPSGSVLYDVIRAARTNRMDADEAVRAIEERLVHPLIARRKKAEADARRARPSGRRPPAWARDADRRLVARLIAAWEDGADPFDTLRQIKASVGDDAPAEPEVTVPEGVSPAMTRCPHRDFDDPTRCRTCHP